MIQRIQTIYLLIVTLLGIFCCILPVVEFDNGLMQWSLSAWELTSTAGPAVQSAHFWGLFSISLLTPIVSFITIWLYRKRMVQIRLCILNILFLIGYYVVLGTCIWMVVNKFNAEFRPNIVAIFPLINIILTWLALRGIGKDEALVRSADRLR